jgi:hypothetical protein
VLDNSFTWWLVNLAVTIAFLTASVVTGSYFVAIAGVIYLVVMMLVELPGTSSEEGSTDDSEDELP